MEQMKWRRDNKAKLAPAAVPAAAPVAVTLGGSPDEAGGGDVTVADRSGGSGSVTGAEPVALSAARPPRPKLMAFQCFKLPPPRLRGSIRTRGPEVAIDIDPVEIDALFKVPIMKKERSRPAAAQREATVLNYKRLLECTIGLRRIKITFEELLAALVACDPMRLEPGGDETAACDMCELLLRIVPHPDEMSELRLHIDDPSNDPEQLSAADKFFLKVQPVEGDLRNRLICMHLSMTLQSRIVAAKEQLLEKLKACKLIFEKLGVPKTDWRTVTAPRHSINSAGRG